MKEKVVKAKDLIPGKEYWCGWASRYAVFVKKHEYMWAGKKNNGICIPGYSGLPHNLQ